MTGRPVVFSEDNVMDTRCQAFRASRWRRGGAGGPVLERQFAALAYAARGWPVLPLHSVESGRCTCGKPNCNRVAKHPRTPHGVKDATTDPKTIREWWAKWPSANVGIALPAGMIGLDVDGEEGRASCEGMLLTPTVHTGRGSHFYLKAPEGVTARNGVGLRPGIDLRAQGGYLVAPPSIHETGAVYRWEIGPEQVELADCPEWISDLLRDSDRQTERRATAEAPTATTTDERIPRGRRNSTLFGFACRLRGVGLKFAEIADTLQTANARRCDPPLTQGEVRTIARSACGYPVGPVRVDRRIANADLSDQARLLAMLLQAGVEDHQLAEAANVTDSTLDHWWTELRAADMEDIARTRPTRRYIELPRGLVTDPDLSVAAKVTALAVAAYMINGVVQVGQEKLAARRKRERARVSNDVMALERTGYLVASRAPFCKAKGRRDRPNQYRWLAAEMQSRYSKMPREAPVEAQETESASQKARIRARGREEHVTSEVQRRAGAPPLLSARSSTRPPPAVKPYPATKEAECVVAAIQGGEAARNLADDPNANISAQRLVRGTGLSVEYVRRMILAHGLDAVNAFANDILAEQHRADGGDW